MDNVNALRSISEMPIDLSVEQIGALQAGIKALQEQAEREKGCSLCNGERLKNVAIVNHWGEDQIALVSGKANEKEKFAFCPKCGRYLGDKND